MVLMGHISSAQFKFFILNKILDFQMNDSSIIQWILNRRYAQIIIIGNRMVYGNWEVLELLKDRVYCSTTDNFFMAACIVVVALRADSLCTWIGTTWVQIPSEATTSWKRLKFFRLIQSHFQDFQIFRLHSPTSFRK